MWVVGEEQNRRTQKADHSTILWWLASCGNKERYEVAFERDVLRNAVGDAERWSDRWFRYLAVPHSIRATSGHGGKGICDEARGVALPDN